MKFFIQIVAILAIVCSLFFLLGYLVSYQTNQSVITVDAPIQFCWDVFHDEDKATQWMDGVESITYTSGSKHQVGAKQKIKLASKPGSGQLSGFSEVIRTYKQVDQPTYLNYDYSNELLNGSTEVRFEMQGDTATVITNVDNFKANKLWMRSVLFLMKRSLKEKSQAQFNQLKSLIENDYNYTNSQARDSIATPLITNEIDTAN